MHTFLNGSLSDVGWWYDHLNEEFNGGQPGLVPWDPSPTKRDAIVLKSLSDAFTAYDERLSEPRPGTIADVSEIRMKRTFLGALKKFDPTGSVSNALETAAKLAFEARNAECQGNVIPIRFRSLMKARLDRVFRYYELARDVALPRFGPGTVLEGWNSVARWQHIQEDLSALDTELHTIARRSICIGRKYSNDFRRFSELLAVPKDWNKPRLITRESSALTFLQQLARRAMLGSLRLDPDTAEMLGRGKAEVQLKHKLLALKASQTRELATLDLSDASDWISFGQVASVFPAGVMMDLEHCRSEEFSSDRYGENRQCLHIYAGMGNATTFTVMTLMFWAMCHAVADYHRLGSRFVSVCGDDIIVDRRLACLLVEAEILRDFGWRLNTRKSMWRSDVYFRESCGMQAFNGHDVTLTRVKGYRNTPEGVLGVAELITRMARARPCLAETIWRETNLPNVRGAPTNSASVDLCWLPRTDVPNRWSKRYQRLEYKVKTFIPDVIRTAPNTAELMFGCLSGQLETEDKSGNRKRGWGKSQTPPFIATSLKRGRMDESWREASASY